MTKPKIIAVDFDGTIVEKQDIDKTDFKFLPYAKEVLQWMMQHFFLILWTCREDEKLDTAIGFLNQNNVKFDEVNKDAPFLDFETSDKIYADFYIDDKSGIEIDWLAIKNYLTNTFLIDDEAIIKEIIVEVGQC